MKILKKELIKNRILTHTMRSVIDHLPKDTELMNVIRTFISAEGTTHYNWKPTIIQAIKLSAVIPTIIAYWLNNINEKFSNEPIDEGIMLKMSSLMC